ncbi:hypothetical protein KIN20_005130 [Parelaphostrongylus tenuis]|uniref:Major sperm protein n=1 Tax=Parelaphostrongylus tenuis TaxID=148309 RepID=A0AAD5QJV1_PARTN|nr:hypothetical protein KIN20_005130 [Parelaphostrongylus tenuis]
MSSIPPGDINTQPNAKIVFNAPYDDKHTYHIKIINASGRRIGWAIKTTNMKRLGVDPACGVLDPKEATLMAVSCDTFDMDVRTPTMIVLPWNGATLPKEPQSSSGANGSREMLRSCILSEAVDDGGGPTPCTLWLTLHRGMGSSSESSSFNNDITLQNLDIFEQSLRAGTALPIDRSAAKGTLGRPQCSNHFTERLLLL